LNIDMWDDWHRKVCRVHPQLIVTGDLHPSEAEARAQLREWQQAGVTTIVDVRVEETSIDFVHRYAPEITYLWAGADDHGGDQPDAWFDTVLERLSPSLHDPAETILVHCHMGVNRAPSMAFRLLLEQGWRTLGALRAIRAARPIAAVLYGDSAIRHHHARRNTDPTRDLSTLVKWWSEIDDDIDLFAT
jgi:dual specificity phosphatase 3